MLREAGHGNAESRAVGAMEERAKCCGHLAGAGKDRTRPALSGSWYCMEGSGRHRAGRTLAALRFGDREEISRGIAVGRSIRQISPGLRTGAIDSKPGDQAQRRQSGLSCKPD